jgi:hypothetical protein
LFIKKYFKQNFFLQKKIEKKDLDVTSHLGLARDLKHYFLNKTS